MLNHLLYNWQKVVRADRSVADCLKVFLESGSCIGEILGNVGVDILPKLSGHESGRAHRQRPDTSLYTKLEFLAHAVRGHHVALSVALVAEDENSDASVLDHRFSVLRPLPSQTGAAGGNLWKRTHHDFVV